MWLYKSLSQKGLSCDFYIVGVEPEKRITGDGLHYEYLDFEKVLMHVANSKCVIEIMQKDNQVIQMGYLVFCSLFDFKKVSLWVFP